MSDFYFICENCGSQDGYPVELPKTVDHLSLSSSSQIFCGFCSHIQEIETTPQTLLP